MKKEFKFKLSLNKNRPLMKKNNFLAALMVLFCIHNSYGQCFITVFGELGELKKTTGSIALDKWLNGIIRDVQQEFYTFPAFYIYDDGLNVNAYADWTDKGRGKVAFGRNLLMTHYDPDDKKSGWTIALILAHEYAHILQFQSHCTLNGKYRELQADFMAGFFLARQGKLSSEDVKLLLKTFYKFGDRRFWDKSHHGTPEERSFMALEGFNCGKKEPSYINAYQSGILCVENHFIRESRQKAPNAVKKVVRPAKK
ncbi:MAG: hypothetical protein RLZZ628_1739 [Bacteroidota bacterium]|jgi:hypothetical protein